MKDQIMDFNVEGIVRENQTEPMGLENWRPWAPSMVMARGTRNTYTDHGMSWDNNGKNGHYAKFQWPYTNSVYKQHGYAPGI